MRLLPARSWFDSRRGSARYAPLAEMALAPDSYSGDGGSSPSRRTHGSTAWTSGSCATPGLDQAPLQRVPCGVPDPAHRPPVLIHPAGGGIATGCSSVWSECSPRTREAVGSNPTILTPQWSIGVVAAYLVLNQTARVRLLHGLRTRPRGGPLGEVVLSTSGTHTPRTGSARGRFAAVAASTWTCGATGAQLVYTESVGGSNPSGFTADACGNPYSARAGCGQFERCAWRLSSGQSVLWS